MADKPTTPCTLVMLNGAGYPLIVRETYLEVESRVESAHAANSLVRLTFLYDDSPVTVRGRAVDYFCPHEA
jgi:hypothetical protein